MVGYAYRRETFDGAIDEARPLAAEDWDETISYKHAVGYDLDESQYRRLEQNGTLRVYIVRHSVGNVGNGEMAGYMVYTILPGGIHSKNSPRAVCLDWFVAKDHRGSRAGIALARFAEDELRNEGIALMSTPIMKTSVAAARVLEYLDHELIGMTYLKILKPREAPHA